MRVNGIRSQREGWEVQTEPWWTDFYTQWWGCGEEKVGGPGAVLEISQEQLWSHFSNLEVSGGKILFREVYDGMYKRMCYAMTAGGRRLGISGMIITGQSGIGTLLCFAAQMRSLMGYAIMQASPTSL